MDCLRKLAFVSHGFISSDQFGAEWKRKIAWVTTLAIFAQFLEDGHITCIFI
jgi:hypothetical protein